MQISNSKSTRLCQKKRSLVYVKLDRKFQTQATLTDFQLHLSVSVADLICSVVIEKGSVLIT